MSDDPYRPFLHFTPRRNWINDPNGLVFHDGRWHLFFQHNPNGDHWADMSWGHAVSTDLVTWEERPVAIRQDVDADGRRVMIGWLSNWDYAKVTPTLGWRGAMTLPRDLTLVATAAGPRPCQAPVPELAAYEHRDPLVNLVLRPGEQRELHGGALRVGYDASTGELVVERAPAAFSEAFGSVSRVAVPLVDGGLPLQVWLDRCSVELFADDGRVALTYLVFPD